MTIMGLYLFGLVGAASSADSFFDTQIEFRNDTDANIRIDVIDRDSDWVLTQSLVSPHSTVIVEANSGLQIFDLAAYRADPVRIHRIGLNLSRDKPNNFQIIPTIFGTYVLDDSGSLNAIPTISLAPPLALLPAPRNSAGTKPGRKNVGMICPGADFGTTRYMIWDSKDDVRYPEHYFFTKNFLCASQGTHMYEIGEVFRYFRCEHSWRDCVRNPSHDGKPVPPIKTSDIPDAALKWAKQFHPDAVFARTQTFKWANGDRADSNFTTYSFFLTKKVLEGCPAGYRLHYQGGCINMEDELEDNPAKGVRMVPPRTSN